MINNSAINEHGPVLPLFFPAALVQFMSQRGFQPETLLKGTGLASTALELPEIRASFNQVVRLISNAEVAWSKPDLGLKFGKSLSVTSLGMIGQAALSSATVGEALETIVNYLAIRDPLQRFTVERQSNGLLFICDSPIPLGIAKRFIIDAGFGSVLAFTEQLAGLSVNGIKFETQLVQDSDPSLYEIILGSEIRFDTARDAFFVPAEILKQIVPTANAMGAREARQYCDAELVRVSPSLGLSSVVRTLIKSSLRTTPNETQVAKICGYSERNLRRRLAKEGTSYTELVREVRQDAAITMLTTTHRGVEGVALELGYKNVGNFCRAFKKWTGKTPSGLRRSLAHKTSYL